MRTAASRHLRRCVSLGVAGIVVAMLVGCTGRGGGQLPPDPALMFKGAASFGFSFSCEDSNPNPSSPTGQLRIQLAYTDQGSNPLGSKFSIHGIVDTLDPVRESMICIGQDPPPGGNELIFLGRYRLTSSPPAGFPTSCPATETVTTPMCRFEVIVRDNDENSAPSMGDYFSIKLSSTTALGSELDPQAVVYARAGLLRSGNLTVE